VSGATLTCRSQAIWAEAVNGTAPDRAALARWVGLSRSMLSRMLSCSSKVPADLARAIATGAGLEVVERGREAFTLAEVHAR
jgi:DNA-binding transcriptional regulator YdaS (Cro superfamily)